MSYSLSFQIKKDDLLKEITLEIEQEINKELKLLAENNIYLERPPILNNKDIPYSPEINSLIGIQLHGLDDLTLNYYYHKIIKFSKKYGMKKHYDKLNEDLNYIYYDDEIVFIVTNEEYENILNNKKIDYNLSITYEDRFKEKKYKIKSLFLMLLGKNLRKEIKRILRF